MPLLMAFSQVDFSQVDFSRRPFPAWAIWVVILIAAAAIAFNFIKKAYEQQMGNASTGNKAPKKAPPPSFHGYGFRRIGHSLGFSSEQIGFLETYGRKFTVSNPEHTLRNPQALDEFLKKAYQDIENHSDSDAAHDYRSSMLFQIREYIDQVRSSGKAIHSTHELQKGTAFTFITPEEEHYTSRIVVVDPSGLACIIPRDGLGQEIRFKRGTKFNCFFYSGPQTGYTFESKVLGYVQSGLSSLMMVRHSDHVSPLPARKHKRRQTSEPCDLTPVNIVVVNNAPKPTRQAVVSGKTYPGQILDLSAGGLSIRTVQLGEAGGYVKIDFSLPQGKSSAIGRIVKVNSLKGSGGIMHLQFAKISRKDINKILSYVYGYSD